MKNIEIFNDYDMVVSYTQKLINDQLTHLMRMGVIHSELIIVQDIKNGNYVYKLQQQGDKIPAENAYIKAQILPQVVISQSGENITLVINFLSGEFRYWKGNGPQAKLKKADMKDWTYGIDITLNLAKVAQTEKFKTPKLVEDQLKHFRDNMFLVSHLFLDFESTNLLRFNPTHTKSGNIGEVYQQQLVNFMQYYLKNLKKHGNPYILGYAINTSTHSKYPPGQSVPSSLKPVGTTFTLYQNPENPEQSNLNFILSTQGGKGVVKGTPGVFDTCWFGKNSQVNAKMIISHADLIEKFIIKPIFSKLREDVYNKISKHIQVNENNDYSAAKKLTADGVSYTISDVTFGDNQYVNKFNVSVKNTKSKTKLKFSGHLYFYKEVNKSVGVCTAKAWSKSSVDWSANVILSTSKNKKGKPELKITQSTSVTHKSHKNHENTCAKAMHWIGEIIGSLLDFFIFFSAGNYFADLFAKVFSVSSPGIGNIGDVFTALSNAVGNVILLPAGQVFFFKSPYVDDSMNCYLDLTYESDNS